MTRMILALVLAPLASGQTLTTTTIASSANPVVFGQMVTLSATVSPAQASGSVTFYDGTVVLGNHNVVSGVAAISVVLPVSGARSLKARFGGAAGSSSSISAALNQTVNPTPATTLQPPVQYSTAMSIYQNVATADFNGDGKMDIVTNNATILFGNGDGTFQKAVVYTSPADSYSVVTGDFNGDGKPDFAAAGYNGTLAIWLNNGDGTFKSPSTVPLAVEPVGIATGDFNNDGIVDIAIASRQGSAPGIGILIGVGDGTFRPVVTYLGKPQSSLAIADFNGDGNADIVVASSDTSRAAILLGNGDGTFKTGATYGASSPYFVAAGDFNRDGKPDFVVDNFNIGQLYVFLGNGDGTFTQTSTSPLTNGFQNEDVVVGDFDGDGIPDLATTNPNPTQPDPISVLLGNGDGTFRGAVNFPAGSGGRALVTGEFNGDGSTDLLVTNQSSLQVLLGGTGAFPTVTTASLPGAMAGTAYSATLAATGGTMPYTWSVSAGTSPIPLSSGGVFSETIPATIKPGPYNFSVVASGPNGPGYFSGHSFSLNIAQPFLIRQFVIFAGTVGTPYVDLPPILTGGTPPYQNWVVSSGSLPPGLSLDASSGLLIGTPTLAGTFTFSVTVNDSAGLTSLPATEQLPVVPTLLVSTTSLPNAVTGASYYMVLSGTGGNPPYGAWTLSSGSLPPGLTLSSATGAISGTPTTSTGSPFGFSITMADLNGMGVVSPPQPLTITVSDPLPITVSLGTSANPSKFGTPITLTATTSLSGAAGKVTFYDGSNVLGTAGVASGKSVFSTGLLGPGAHKLTARFFGPPSAPTVSAAVSQVVSALPSASLEAPVTYVSGYFSSGNTPFAVADFNGDGKSDLATFGSILLGNGDGTFQTPLMHTVGDNALSLATGDLNEDGVTDMVVSDNNGIEVFAGKGNGTFGQPVAYGGFSAGGSHLAVGDFNGDGHADLIGYTGSGIGLFLGVGDGTFRPATTIAPGITGPVVMDDFNGDGKPDIAVANASSVSIVFGNGDGTFQSPVTYPVPVTPYGSTQNYVSSADLNGDGISDLVFNSAGQLNIMLGRGDGTFGQPYLILNSGVQAPVIISDFNGDGIPDLALFASSAPSAIVVLPGKGDGTFGPAVSYAVGSGAFELAVGDFNTDGRPDIVASNGEKNLYMQLATSSPADSQLTVSPAKLSVPITLSGPASQTVTLTYQTDVQGSPQFVSGLSNSSGFELPTVAPASGTMTLASHVGSLYTYTAAVQVSVSDPFVFPGATDQNSIVFAAGGPIVSFPVTVTSQYAPQTITFAPLNGQTLDATLPALSATASSGLPVTFISQTPAVCTVSGTTMTLVSAGTCSIFAQQPGNASYAFEGVSQSFTVYPLNVSPPPAPQPTGGIANAASAGQAIPSVVEPGSYIAIYGTSLAGNGNPSATTLPLPTTLNGTQIFLCNIPMPLLYASATQINALVPQAVAPGGGCPLVVVAGTAKSAPIQLAVTELQPGIYTLNESGSGPGIVTNALTGQLISASNPAHAADYLVIYCTGLGLLRGPQDQSGPTDGVAAPSTTLFYTDATVTATIGGVAAPVFFSGLTPTLAGLYQINIQVPPGVTPGNTVPLVIAATDAGSGASARSNSVTIVVQ